MIVGKTNQYLRTTANDHALNGILCVVILENIMPIVSRLISMYLSTYVYLLLLLIALLLMLFGGRRYSWNTYVVLLLPFIAWKMLTLFNRANSIVNWGYAALLDFLPLMLGFCLLYDRQKPTDGWAKLIFWTFFLTSVTTLVGQIADPDASRWIATVEDSQNPLLISYDLKNIGGYGFIYTAVLLYPLLIYAYKRRVIKLPFAVSVAAFFGATVFLSGYATAMILYFASSCLFLVRRDLSVKKLIVAILLGVVLYFVFSSVISALLLELANITPNGNLAERLTSIAGGLSGIEQSESNRMELYRRSINTFFQHPLIGTFLSGDGGGGGHSFLLDFLAHFGCIGFLLLVFMYKKIYRFFYAPFRNQNGYGYIVWTFFQAIVLSAINTGMWLNVLAFFAPVIIYYIEGKETGR